MSVHLRLEESPEGSATLSQHGKLIGHPSVRRVASAAEAKRQAQMLALAGIKGLRSHGCIDTAKSAPGSEKPPKACRHEIQSGSWACASAPAGR